MLIWGKQSQQQQQQHTKKKQKAFSFFLQLIKTIFLTH